MMTYIASVLDVIVRGSCFVALSSMLLIVWLIFRDRGKFREELVPGNGMKGVLRLLEIVASRDIGEFEAIRENRVLAFLWTMAGVSGTLLVISIVLRFVACMLDGAKPPSCGG